ncbi:Mariner Mos1 transposase [Araneus ventricosus]|uniref:Mariner Mos1 transposase n=1 Tax=Araneus ventricosus TaxID=182803 RepID=A0A4Y2KJW3_ARAVE|nr:Mariner Mos1 transposase [Araneus ventricosus]
MAIGCSHGLAYSIMHESFEFPESVHMLGPPTTDAGTQKKIEWACPCKGVMFVLAKFGKIGEAVNAQSYCDVLFKLQTAIRSKRPGLLCRRVLFHHDNVRPHIAHLTQDTIANFGWSVLQHPPYSPDLATSDFHLFGPLKQHLGGKHFADDDDVQHEVLLWMRQQPKEFYAAGIGALIKRWDKCINIDGDYVEK